MRRGLSYLEVLIAAGIGLIGIMGAIALFPIAIRNMTRGVIEDVASAAGPAALDSVEILRLNDSKAWMFRTGGAWIPLDNPAANPSRTDVGGRAWNQAVGAAECFCFDPRMAAQVTTWGAGYDPDQFPFVASTGQDDVRMRRLTLNSGMGGTGIMPTAQARLLFKLQDDLIFDRPTDNTAAAQQANLLDSTNARQRRDYMADYEVIYTACPQVTLSPFNGALSNSGEYLVSAAILHQRQANLTEIAASQPGNTFQEEERVLDVVQFLGNGFNGGDVLIQSRDNRPIDDLSVMEGQWVLLSAMSYSPPGVPPGGAQGFTQMGPTFGWYKVTSLQGEAEAAGNRFQRYLTLEGADWPVEPNKNRVAIPSQQSTASGIVTTRLSIISGASAVYSRSMQLQ